MQDCGYSNRKGLQCHTLLVYDMYCTTSGTMLPVVELQKVDFILLYINKLESKKRTVVYIANEL